MAYQSKARRFEQEPRLYSTQLIFNTTEDVDLPSGLTVSRPVEAFRRWGAPYRNSQTLIASIDGFNSKTDFTYAIRKSANDKLSKLDFDTSMIVKIAGYKDLEYNIQQLSVADNSTKNAYHLITLRLKKNY